MSLFCILFALMSDTSIAEFFASSLAVQLSFGVEFFPQFQCYIGVLKPRYSHASPIFELLFLAANSWGLRHCSAIRRRLASRDSALHEIEVDESSDEVISSWILWTVEHPWIS